MKNKRILLLLFCALLGARAVAQKFDASTEANPKWYFIQVNGGENAGKVMMESDGKVVVTPQATGLKAKVAQLWRFEKIGTLGADDYYAVIGKSGKKLDAVYDATLEKAVVVLSETPATNWFASAKALDSGGTAYYLTTVTPPEPITAKYLTFGTTAQNNLVYIDGYSTNSLLQFVPFEGLIYSNANETAWMTLHTAKAALSNRCVTEEEENSALNAPLSMQEYEVDNYHQQWKLVTAPGNTTNFVNRATGHKIGTTPVFDRYNYIQYTDTEDNQAGAGWTLTQLPNSAQYEISTGPAATAKYWNATIAAATVAESREEYHAGASKDTGFAWTFKFADAETNDDGAAIYSPATANGVDIYVRDRRIVVDSDAPYQIYTLYGARVSSNRELPTGVYLVTVQGQTAKVIVK